MKYINPLFGEFQFSFISTSNVIRRICQEGNGSNSRSAIAALLTTFTASPNRRCRCQDRWLPIIFIPVDRARAVIAICRAATIWNTTKFNLPFRGPVFCSITLWSSSFLLAIGLNLHTDQRGVPFGELFEQDNLWHRKVRPTATTMRTAEADRQLNNQTDG